MTIRRAFLGSIPVTGTAFALGGTLFGEGPARAQDAPPPLAGHFHPKGKAPSVHTIQALQESAAGLPFADTRDLEEHGRGFIAPLPDLQIMADAGNVAWDQERFLFTETQESFDSIHPSLLRIARLNNNYGLYEVVPGIYQVRGPDLANITFVRGKTGWIIFDIMTAAETARAS
jgi:alkyl sulfatase BDS1-like metallo-beta-lactamase superfamily hydrolase